MAHEDDPGQPNLERIDVEITAGIEQAGSVHGFINNFPANLTGGAYRVQIEQFGLEGAVLADPELAGHSDRARNVTWEEFFADVDRAVRESGVDTAELERLQSIVAEAKFGQTDTREMIGQLVLPAYRLLRLDYSHFDLTR